MNHTPIYVTRSSLPDFEEYCSEIRDLWDTRFLTNMGSKHLQLEEALKTYLQTPNITLFANGHLALENIITAMGLRGEIITSPFTFASTTHAIVRCGCTPVFCDINPVDYTIDVTKIESLITDKTVAILPIHTSFLTSQAHPLLHSCSAHLLHLHALHILVGILQRAYHLLHHLPHHSIGCQTLLYRMEENAP